MTVCRILFTLAVLGPLSLIASTPLRAGEVKDFTLPSATDDSLIRLSDYSGEVVLIHFWQTTCGWCQREMPKLVEIDNKYRDRGLRIIGVSCDGPSTVGDIPEFLGRHDASFPVGLSDRAEFGRDILPSGTVYTPHNFIVSRDGEIESLGAIREPDEDWKELEQAIQRRLAEPAPDEPAITPRKLDSAPEFSLKDLKDRQHTLEDYRGKPLVVTFFTDGTASWAGMVFSGLHDAYAAQGLQVLGIHLFGDDEGMNDYIEQYEAGYPVLRGTRDVQREWIGSNSAWATFFVTAEGKVLKRWTTASTNDTEKVIFPRYAEYLLASQKAAVGNEEDINANPAGGLETHALSQSSDHAAQRAAGAVTIALTADTEGHVGPCDNCPGEKGLGGLAPRATVVSQLRKKHTNLLLLDAGNALFGDESLASDGEVILAAYNRIGYDAVNLSYHDFYRGKETTLALLDQAEFAPLSANLLDEATGEPLVNPYVVNEIGGTRVAVIGVTQRPAVLNLSGRLPPALKGLGEQMQGIRIEKPMKALAEWLPKVREKADRVTLLYYGSPFELAKIREKFGGQVEAIGVGGIRPNSVPKDAQPPLIASSKHGRHLAQLRLRSEAGEDPPQTVQQMAVEPEIANDSAMEELLAQDAQGKMQPAEPKDKPERPVIMQAGRADSARTEPEPSASPDTMKTGKTGIELNGVERPNFEINQWNIYDADGDEQIAVVDGEDEFQELRPGKYRIGITPSGSYAKPLNWTNVDVQEGKTTVVRVDSGIELIARTDDDKPPYGTNVVDASTDEQVAYVYKRWGFTPLPPGTYRVSVKPQGSYAKETVWTDVEVQEGKVSTLRVDSGIELIGRTDDDKPPYGTNVVDASTDEQVAYVYKRWGFTPLPPGTYRVSMKPQGSYAKEIAWTDVEVQEGKTSAVHVDSGVELVGLSEDDEAPKEWKVFDAESDEQVGYVYKRWGYTPLPPGDYYVMAPFPGVEARTEPFTVRKGSVKRLTVRDFGIAELDIELPAARGVRLASGNAELEVVVFKRNTGPDSDTAHKVFKGSVGEENVQRWVRIDGDVIVQITSGEMVLETPATASSAERTKVPFDTKELARRHGLSLFKVRWPEHDSSYAVSRVIVMDAPVKQLLHLEQDAPPDAQWLTPPRPVVRLHYAQEEMVYDAVPVDERVTLEFQSTEEQETDRGVEVDIAIQTPEDGQFVVGDRTMVAGQASTAGPAGATRVAIVLDRSGSTSDSSGADLDGDGNEESILDAEVAAASRLLEVLHEIELEKAGTNFEIALVRFNGSGEAVKPFTRLSAPAALKDLQKSLDRIQEEGSSGGTDFQKALDEALTAFRNANGDGPSVIIFSTDGRASTGLSAAARAGWEGVTLHAVGLGDSFPEDTPSESSVPPQPRDAADMLATLAAAGSPRSTAHPLPRPADIVSLVPQLPVEEFPEAALREVVVTNATTGELAFDVALDEHGFFEADVPVSLLPQGTYGANTLQATAIAKEGSQATDRVRVRGKGNGELTVGYHGETQLPRSMLPAVLLVLDSSGSMDEPVDGQPKYLVAREVVDDVLTTLSQDIQLGLRLFGHWGRWLPQKNDSDAAPLPLNDPRLNTDSELVVRIGPLTPEQRQTIKRWLDWAKPQGQTPLVYSLLQAIHDFPSESQAPKTVVLVSDGQETAGGDLEDVAATYRGSEIDAVVHVVGFDIKDTEAERQLQRIAEMGRGKYYTADDAGELTEALRSAVQEISYLVVNPEESSVVARGSVNGRPVELKPSEYRVRLLAGASESISVTLNPGEEVELELDEHGKLSAP